MEYDFIYSRSTKKTVCFRRKFEYYSKTNLYRYHYFIFIFFFHVLFAKQRAKINERAIFYTVTSIFIVSAFYYIVEIFRLACTLLPPLYGHVNKPYRNNNIEITNSIQFHII